MSDQPKPADTAISSRQRYRKFVQDYKLRRLNEATDGDKTAKNLDEAAAEGRRHGKRREYVRAYFRWLGPHRYAVGAVMLLALFVAGMEMIEPLFMRFIVDRVLLKPDLVASARLNELHLAGALFLGLII